MRCYSLNLFKINTIVIKVAISGILAVLIASFHMIPRPWVKSPWESLSAPSISILADEHLSPSSSIPADPSYPVPCFPLYLRAWSGLFLCRSKPRDTKLQFQGAKVDSNNDGIVYLWLCGASVLHAGNSFNPHWKPGR